MTYTPKIRALFVGILAALSYAGTLLYIDSGAGVTYTTTELVNFEAESSVLTVNHNKGITVMSNINPVEEINKRVAKIRKSLLSMIEHASPDNYRKTKRASNRRDVTGEVPTSHLKPKLKKKTVILKYDPRKKKSHVLVVETDQSVLGEGRENLKGYVEDTQRIIDSSNCPEKEMESLLNAGRFRRMSMRFYPTGIFQEDIEFVAATEYYNKRAHGATVDRAFQAAKYKAFHVALEYYRLNRRYKQQDGCDCANCYFGRPSQCLNGVPVIRPQIEVLSIDRTLENGQLVSDLIALETPDRYQDWQWVMFQMALLYESCHDWRDVKIIDGKRQGETLKEIAHSLGWKSHKAVQKRLTAIGDRFLSIEQ